MGRRPTPYQPSPTGWVTGRTQPEGYRPDPSDLDALTRYIDNQEQHHRKVSYQEEYRAFLIKYGVDFDERYIWA